MGKKAMWVGASMGVLALVAGLNVVRVHAEAKEATKHRHTYSVAAYYHMGVVPDVIVYDLRDVGWEASTAGVLGGFFEFAEQMKDREFRHVRLAHRGKTKFILDGDDFQEIGRTHSFQNPVYTFRTFPEKLRDPDGGRAFSSWTGGAIGVLGAQMGDANQMARKWFIDDLGS